MQPQFSPTDPAHNACVHAAAGTGKTWQLVTRIIRLLLSGADPAGILAVTFTRKAAAEMLERLATRLKEFAGADDRKLRQLLAGIDVDPDRQTLQRARALYETLLLSPVPLRATTFHAFCQEILQRFPLDAGVPPGFELLESEAAAKQAAWDALFDELTSTPAGALAGHVDALFEACGSLDSTRKALDSFLSSRMDWWALATDQAAPVDFAAKQLVGLLDIDPSLDPLVDFFSDARCALLGEFAGLIGQHDTRTNLAHQALIQRALLPDRTPEERFQDIRTAFLTQANKPRDRKSNATLCRKLGDARAERLIELHLQLANDVVDCMDQLARRTTWRRTVAWYHAGQRLLEHFQRQKYERRELDFNDLEWRTCCLLNSSDNALWVQYKLDTRIDHLLIDEFQDTNPTQWRLLLPLMEELAAGDDDRRRSVFLVGDAKQSIYRFRRADAGLLSAATNWLGEHLQAGTHTLDASRRSSPAIIDFVNRTFDHGVLQERLRDFRRHSTYLTELWGRVEILPMVEIIPESGDDSSDNTDLRDPLSCPRQVEEDTRHYQEGLVVAQRIREQVKHGLPVQGPDCVSPLRYSDILILMRNRTHLLSYQQALRDQGIPYIGGSRGTLLESLEVRDLEAVLATLIAPWNNLCLAQVLRSPLFSVSDDDLMLLAKSGGGTWIDRLYLLAETLPESHALKIAAACLSRWHKQVGLLPVHDLLDRIYHEGDVVNRYTAGFPAALRPRVRANLTRFLELALEIDSGRYPSLPHFLDRLRDLRDRPSDAPDDAPPDSSGADRVRIMTIHSAKGLEAPAVFLVDTATIRKPGQAWQALVNWPSDKDRPVSFLLAGRKEDLDGFSRGQIDQLNEADAIEEASLLYVALTRAKQFLTISASAPARGSETGWYGLLSENLDQAGACRTSGGWISGYGVFPKITEQVVQEESRTSPIEPGLARPLKLARLEREIAPSQADERSPARISDDSDAQGRGIAIHRFLELLTGEPVMNCDQALAIVASEQQRDTDDPELKGWLVEAEQTVSNDDFRYLFDRKQYVRAYNEVAVSYELDTEFVHGTIDRLIVHEHRIDIIDYKTHRIAVDELVAASTQYQEQLRLYARGVTHLWPDLPVHTWLLFTACKRLIEVPAERGSRTHSLVPD